MEVIKSFFDGIWNYFINQITSIGIVDVIDIAVVSVVFYYVFRFIRDRRAGKLALGVVLLVLFQILSEVFNLVAMKFLMQNVFQVGLLALIIVFQPELRSVLEKVGGDSIKGLRSIGEVRDGTLNAVINEICEAASDMSAEKIGALIVIERLTKLGDVIKSGTIVNADVSAPLIKNVFFNKAPLHDGAVIIRDMRLCAAGCFLPLSMNDDIIRDLGTRHRAAIGMSENSDAVVIVVSEETGTVSVAIDGQLKRNYNYETLRHELIEQLNAGDIKQKITRKSADRTEKKSEQRTGRSKRGIKKD